MGALLEKLPLASAVNPRTPFVTKDSKPRVEGAEQRRASPPRGAIGIRGLTPPPPRYLAANRTTVLRSVSWCHTCIGMLRRWLL